MGPVSIYIFSSPPPPDSFLFYLETTREGIHYDWGFRAEACLMGNNVYDGEI